MRTQVVTVNNKTITVQEMRIGELETLMGKLFPETGGDISKLNVSAVLDSQLGFGLLYDKLPILFPDLQEEDIKRAYMSEIEALIQAFVDVNFLGIKKVVGPVMALARAGLMQK